MSQKEVRLGESKVVKFSKDRENYASWLLDDLPKNGNVSEANGGDYVEKLCFVAKNLLYQIMLLCPLYLL